MLSTKISEQIPSVFMDRVEGVVFRLFHPITVLPPPELGFLARTAVTHQQPKFTGLVYQEMRRSLVN